MAVPNDKQEKRVLFGYMAGTPVGFKVKWQSSESVGGVH